MIQLPNYADLLLLAYETDFLQGFLKNKDIKKIAQIFNFSFHYIDDLLSLNNSRFAEHLHHIYPNVLEVEDTTDNQKSDSYLDPDLEIINGGRLKTNLYDKGNDFNFPIVKLPLHQ